MTVEKRTEVLIDVVVPLLAIAAVLEGIARILEWSERRRTRGVPVRDDVVSEAVDAES